MKTKTKLLTSSLLFIAAGTLMAADPGVRYTDPPPPDRFRANEFSIDLFGTGSVNEDVLEHVSGDRITTNGRLGAGAGVNYFFTRNFGIEAEGYSENTQHAFVDNASGSLVWRFPIEPVRLAPYLFIGGGYQFDPIRQGFGHGGVGLDIRIVHNWGFFVDARYVITGRSENFGLGRAGVRLAF
jgi:hypothetical protein